VHNKSLVCGPKQIHGDINDSKHIFLETVHSINIATENSILIIAQLEKYH